MKRILIFLSAIMCLCGCEAKYTEFWSEASYATIDAITGTYSLCSGTWNSEIDLSGEGFASDNILNQLEIYGWTGIQTIKYEEDSEQITVFNQSLVSIPQKPEHLTQINLYVPYPEYDKDQNEETVLQFHYKVNSKGDIEIFNTHDRKMCGYGAWQDGTMNLTYRHN